MSKWKKQRENLILSQEKEARVIPRVFIEGHYTVETKLKYLQQLQEFKKRKTRNGYLNEFCREHGLNPSTVSKWTRQASRLQVRNHNAKHVRHSHELDPIKDRIAHWVTNEVLQGRQIDIITLRRYAESSASSLFKGTKTYNSRYTACRRMLQELAYLIRKSEETRTAISLTELHRGGNSPLILTDGPGIDVSKLYEHIRENHGKKSTIEAIRHTINYGYCKCKGNNMREISCVLQANHYYMCTEVCDEECSNRRAYFECTATNCNVGATCSNRHLQQHPTTPNIEPFQTIDRGIGLRTQQRIPPKTPVLEYVGEYVEWMEFDTRELQEANKSGYQDQVYAMSLSDGCVIDAKRTGNLARFINHSCAPNCQAMKWYVDQMPRVVIVTTADIQPFEELTINYNNTAHNKTPAFICMCSRCKSH